MPWERQLNLDFTSSDKPSAPRTESEPKSEHSVAEIADSLRPRLLNHLRNAANDVGITAIRAALGHPGPTMDQDPQSNPVNFLLKQMRDAGEIVCHEPDWGEPTFSLPAKTNPSKPELGSWEHDVKQRFEHNFVQPVIDELEQRPWSTAEAIGNRALGRMQIHNKIRTAADILREQVEQGTVQIAWDEGGIPHYAVAGIAVAAHLATQEQIDQAGGEFSAKTTPLVRPDRQYTFDGKPHWQWPEAKHDRDSISVDRLYEDIDGPSHRFVIHRDDTVEAFFSKGKLERGVVVGISHAEQQVSVRFEGATNGIWFNVGQIYPVAPETEEGTAPLSDFTDADRVDHQPYSIHAFREYRKRYETGDSTLAEHWAEFARLSATREQFIAGLQSQYDATRLKVLANQFGCFDARRNNKLKNAEYVYRVLMQSFTLARSVQFDPMRETLEQAVTRQVEALTDEEWQKHLSDQQAEQEHQRKALSNPESLDEFRLFVRQRSVEELTSQQRIRFDELLADVSRSARRSKISDTVTKIESEGAEDLELTIKEGYHDKKKVPLWIVQLSTRVDRPTYNELNRKAKMLGGWFSSFKKSDAGFQFTSREIAERFVSLLDSNVGRGDVLEDRKARKMTSASQHLIGVAESLDQEAGEILHADDSKLKNTVRRAEMAAGMRGRAYGQQAMAATLRRIAADLDSGQATYLDGVRAATHISTLIALLRRGKTKRNETLLDEKGELGMWDRHRAVEELDNRQVVAEDAAFAEFPYPSIYRRHFEELLATSANKKGLKQLTRRMQPFAVGDRDRYSVDFVDDYDIELLTDYLARCRSVGLETRWVDQGLENYKRLRAANIHTPQELRCALRELVPYLTKKRDDDPIVKAEEALIGQKIPGFFPTPKSIISRMLEVAQIRPGDRVLEPSAGKGDILDMIRDRHPDATVSAIERHATLVGILNAKNHDVAQGDFLQHNGQYDVILMNPPFANSQDIEHVRHAYEQLDAGGRLVAIMSQGPFFRSDAKAEDFRDWLSQVEGDHEQLPDDAFRGPQAFRETGVSTQLVTIARPIHE